MTKLCECGCGNAAPISKINRPERGQRKGEPVKFIRGHSMRGRHHTDEAKAKIIAAGLGRKHTAESKKKQSEIKRGALNPGWKGGEFVSKGRVLVRVGRDHPMANSSGYVFQHRLVLAAALGRMLTADEHVHHLDFDPLNNAPENLIVLSNSQHQSLHRLIDQTRLKPDEALRRVLTV